MKFPRSSSVQRRIAGMLVFVVVSLIASVAVSFYLGRAVELLDGLRDRAAARGAALDDVLTAMSDTEVAQRSFAASHQEGDLTAFEAARSRTETALRSVRAAHAADPVAAAAIARIDIAASAMQRTLLALVDLSRSTDAAPRAAALAGAYAREHMTEVRRLIGELKAVERATYEEQSELAKHRRSMVLLVEAMLVALMITIAVAGYQSLMVEAEEQEARGRQLEVEALSERRLRRLTDNLPALISHVGADERLQYANCQFLTAFGGSADTLVGQPLATARGAEAYSAIAPQVRAALAGQEVTFEHQTRVGDSDRTFDETYVPDIGEGGQVRGFYAVAFDITDRRAAEARLAQGERRLRDVTNNIPALVAYFDLDERCRFANEPARRHMRKPPGGFDGATLAEMFTIGQYASYAPHAGAVREGRRVSFETTSDSKVSRYQTAHAIPDLGDDGTVRGFYLMVYDITDVKEAEHARAEGERHLKSITDNIPALIMHMDTQERVTFANDTFREWLGADPNAMLGKLLRDVVGDKLYFERQAYLQRALAGERLTFFVVSEARGIERHLDTVYIPDVRADGQVAGVFTLSTDVSALKRVEQKLEQLARVDTLTALPNRRQFDEKLTEALARTRRYQHEMALMFLDVDHFKSINDTHGHGGGDQVLVEFARRLARCVRGTDTVARLAGDEFVILLEGLQQPDDASVIAEKIRAELVAPFVLDDGTPVGVTASMGIALVDDADRFPAAVVAKADAALYRAKRAGRNTFAVSV